MKISASDWAIVSVHFDRLADLPPQQRPSELAALDLDDRHRQLLADLLEQHDRADSLGLDTGAPERLGLGEAPEQDAALPDWQGQRLGPWQVDEVIGRGGMSVIHRGHRADGQFDKEVAIKVLNRRQLVGDAQRLGEEVRILARLEHPGIARLIDSGTSEAGHGYLVMELVRGQPIDEAFENEPASAHIRVARLIDAARALEYAHRRQVVHCDIKPGNLLLREDGQVCLVDFGIATLLERQSSASRRLYCSPAYTAPERFAGAPSEASQDVYSLGMVLSRLVDVSRHRDLAAICDKACARKPDDRYAAMSEFRAELEAWQARRPVAARGGGHVYVLGRWLQRHALAASLGLMVLLSLGIGATAALWQAREARVEASRAIAARDFLISIFEAADPALSRGEDPPASTLLRRGAERVRTTMADQPRLLAEMLHVIGRTQLERGLIGDARDSLDAALGRAIAQDDSRLRLGLLSDRGLAAYEAGLFDAAVGYLAQARALALETDLAGEALDRIEVRLADMHLVNGQAEQALIVLEPLLARLDAASPSADAIRADAQRVRGAALQELGELDEAQRVLEEALALQERRDDDDILLAKIENDLGIVYWYQSDLESAARVFQRSLEHKLAVYGEDHPQTLSTLGNLAGVNMARGDHAGAEATWRRSLGALERVHEGTHPDIVYTWGMLGWSRYLREDLPGALADVETALTLDQGLSERDPAMGWLRPLRGLLRLELDQPGALPDLVELDHPCTDLAVVSDLQRRGCLARRLLETDPPGDCRPDQLPAASAEVLEALPPRWRQVHGILRARCQDTGASLPRADKSDATPTWLLRRLADDV